MGGAFTYKLAIEKLCIICIFKKGYVKTFSREVCDECVLDMEIK